MNNSVILLYEEKFEMIEDGKNISRRKVFQAARFSTQYL